MAKFRHHILVCENERPADSPKGCCAGKGGAEIREAIKAEIEKRGWRKIVRATSTKCIDQCALGPVIAIYPDDTWYGGVKKEDVPRILDSLQEGCSVESLRIPEDQLSGRMHTGPLP